MPKEKDPRDFSLYGGPMEDYGKRSVQAARIAYAASLLEASTPCAKTKTKSGREVKLAANVMLTAFEISLIQRALSGYLRETMTKPRHLQRTVEDMIEVLMHRLAVMEGD